MNLLTYTDEGLILLEVVEIIHTPIWGLTRVRDTLTRHVAHLQQKT
mgnify:FL=1|jgi:hypothetical protein